MVPPTGAADRCGAREPDQWFERAFTIAHRCARLHGFSHDDAEDCAMEFVLRFLRRPGEVPGGVTTAWLYRCAGNHTVDFQRARNRLRRRETRWDAGDAGEPPATEVRGNPLGFFLRAACWDQIMQAVQQLSGGQRELFVRHHLGDEPIASLAVASGKTCHAVEQALFRARQRVRSVLERHGWSEPELRTCLNGGRLPAQRPAQNPKTGREMGKPAVVIQAKVPSVGRPNRRPRFPAGSIGRPPTAPPLCSRTEE